MKTLLFIPSTYVWLLAMAATAFSWWLGGWQGKAPDDANVAMVASGLMLVAFVKVRFVLQYFMDARSGPLALRIITDAYALLAFTAVMLTYFLSN